MTLGPKVSGQVAEPRTIRTMTMGLWLPSLSALLFNRPKQRRCQPWNTRARIPLAVFSKTTIRPGGFLFHISWIFPFCYFCWKLYMIMRTMFQKKMLLNSSKTVYPTGLLHASHSSGDLRPSDMQWLAKVTTTFHYSLLKYFTKLQKTTSYISNDS